jgi:nucleotide-binding universal stress UspA family protein
MGEIVVGVDGSDSSRQALEWAAREAEVRGADLVIVKNWRDPMFGGPGFSAMYETDLILSDAKAQLEALASDVHDAHPEVHVGSVLLDGSPAASLVKRGDVADLLVVGSRGNGGFLGLELGSVSAKVARRSVVPVVVVRGEHDRSAGSEVVVGVDGSSCSRQALRWAADWARAHDKELVVLMAWNYLDPQGPDGPVPFDPEYDGERAAAVLDQIVADVLDGRPNPRISTETVCELPARAVLQRAADACLVVVGRHGVSHWSLPELGATAIQILHHAACPVAVIPEAHRADEHADT